MNIRLVMLLLSVATSVGALCGCGWGGSGETSPPTLQAWQPLGSMPALPVNVSSDDLYPWPDEAHLALDDTDHTPIVAAPAYIDASEVLHHDGVGMQRGTYDNFVLSVGLQFVRGVDLARANSGSLVLIVVGDDVGASTKGRAKIYVDSNNDGEFETTEETSSLTLATEPPSGSRFTRVSAGEGVAFILDSRNNQVLRVEDTNADGVPDSIATTPFVDSTKTHEIQDTKVISWDPDDECLEMRDEETEMLVDSKEVVRIRDINSDGVADEYEIIAPTAPDDDVPMAVAMPMFSGSSSMVVTAPQSSSVEVWSVDSSDGSLISLIGTVVLAAGQTHAALPVSPALVDGATYVAKDVATGTLSEVSTVQAQPTFSIVSATPTTVDSTVGATVVLRGFGFFAGMKASVSPPCLPVQGEETDLAVSFISAEEVSIVVSPLLLPARGPATICLWDVDDFLDSVEISWTRP